MELNGLAIDYRLRTLKRSDLFRSGSFIINFSIITPKFEYYLTSLNCSQGTYNLATTDGERTFAASEKASNSL